MRAVLLQSSADLLIADMLFKWDEELSEMETEEISED